MPYIITRGYSKEPKNQVSPKTSLHLVPLRELFVHCPQYNFSP